MVKLIFKELFTRELLILVLILVLVFVLALVLFLVLVLVLVSVLVLVLVLVFVLLRPGCVVCGVCGVCVIIIPIFIIDVSRPWNWTALSTHSGLGGNRARQCAIPRRHSVSPTDRQS